MAMLVALLYALMTGSIQFSCPFPFALNASLRAASLKYPAGRALCMPMMNKDGSVIMQRSVWPNVLYDMPLICSAKRYSPR